MKPQPFCCDITSGATEEQQEYKRLFMEASGYDWQYKSVYYGVDKDGDFGCDEMPDYAKKMFNKIISLSEGIEILKQVVEEDNVDPIKSALMQAIALLKKSTEYEVLDDWKESVNKIESILKSHP